MANQPVANLINVRVQNACKFVYKFASSLPIRKFSANSVLNLHTCKRICKFVGNPKLANKGIATVQTNSKFSSISLQRICITCNFLANPTFRPVFINVNVVCVDFISVDCGLYKCGLWTLQVWTLDCVDFISVDRRFYKCGLWTAWTYFISVECGLYKCGLWTEWTL